MRTPEPKKTGPKHHNMAIAAIAAPPATRGTPKELAAPELAADLVDDDFPPASGPV